MTDRRVEDHTVTLTRTYDAPVEDVWDACTNPERIPRWFLPVSGDLRAGGRYQLQGNAGGTIESCDPPRAFAATWEIGEQVGRIELELAEDGGGTRLTLRHTVPDDDHWRRFGPGAVGVGWEMAETGLAQHLGAEVAALDREFIVRSSTGWGEAHAAGGADAGTARAAAEATAQAYTGG